MAGNGSGSGPEKIVAAPSRKAGTGRMSFRPTKLYEPDLNKATVAIIGGGFAGLGACRHLRKRFNVVLIDAKEYFEYYPGILRAYLHPTEHNKLTSLYQPVCDDMEVKFVWGEVTRIEPESKMIRVRCMAREKTKESLIEYNYCIICSGSQYGLYMRSAENASGAGECLWYPTFLTKTMDTTTRWEGLDERFISGRRAHFEMELKVLKELAAAKSTIVIVGAGFIGIEWATEVKYYLPDINVVVLEQRSECVSVMPPKCRQYCQRYMERCGIKTIYDVDYKSFLSPGDSRNCCNAEMLAKYGITQVARVYMAVGVRSLNQFLPAECLDHMMYDEGTGDVTRGGWILTNRNMQVLHRGVTTWGEGRIFAAGNCCAVQGVKAPKNSFPGEDMAAIACHNIEVMERRRNPKFGGCFSCLSSKNFKELSWNWGFGLCATSLGPYDATFVAGSTEDSGSGYTVLTGCLAAYQKEFIRWSKVNQNRNGWLGWAIWGLVH